jgi:hypothetical protein
MDPSRSLEVLSHLEGQEILTFYRTQRFIDVVKRLWYLPPF